MSSDMQIQPVQNGIKVTRVPYKVKSNKYNLNNCSHQIENLRRFNQIQKGTLKVN